MMKQSAILLFLFPLAPLALGQAVPAARGPAFYTGWHMPDVSGTLNYSLTASERLRLGASNSINNGDTFDISAAGSHDGLDWVSVKPRSAEADFSHAELGFAGDRLARMVVNDRLGQTVQLDFQHSERNARVESSELQFKPPGGVDVIGTPQS